MMIHPDASMPPDQLRNAYADLLSTLARHEPDALRRAATALEAGAERQPSDMPAGSPGARLARSWLAYTQTSPSGKAPPRGEVYTLTYPAHVVFEVRGAGGPVEARSIAHRSVGALLESDAPLASLPGPLAAEPAISNVVVWVGSPTGEGDALELEMIAPGRGTGDE